MYSKLINQRVSTIIAVLLVTLAMCGASCQRTDSEGTDISWNAWKSYEVADAAYRRVMSFLATAREAGKIDDDEYREIEEIRLVASQALEDMEAAAAAGEGEQTFDFIMICSIVNSTSC